MVSGMSPNSSCQFDPCWMLHFTWLGSELFMIVVPGSSRAMEQSESVFSWKDTAMVQLRIRLYHQTAVRENPSYDNVSSHHNRAFHYQLIQTSCFLLLVGMLVCGPLTAMVSCGRHGLRLLSWICSHRLGRSVMQNLFIHLLIFASPRDWTGLFISRKGGNNSWLVTECPQEPCFIYI